MTSIVDDVVMLAGVAFIGFDHPIVGCIFIAWALLPWRTVYR